ncbi:hypothetical protein WJG45_002392 [Klebsiella aerogenes]
MNFDQSISLISAIATVSAAVIACIAAWIGYKTLNSWKDKERFMQLVRLKRSIFTYRQRIEHISVFNHDNHKINEYILNVLQPALTDVYHEMRLAGFEEGESKEYKLFESLFSAQQEYMSSHLDYGSLINSAIELQKAIDIDYKKL